MKKRKHPFSMFCMGTILNLIRMWPFFIVVIILYIICLVNPVVPIAVPIVLTGFMVSMAIMQQFRNRKILISRFENEKSDELLDKMFLDNSKGYKNVTTAIDEVIKNYNSDLK